MIEGGPSYLSLYSNNNSHCSDPLVPRGFAGLGPLLTEGTLYPFPIGHAPLAWPLVVEDLPREEPPAALGPPRSIMVEDQWSATQALHSRRPFCQLDPSGFRSSFDVELLPPGASVPGVLPSWDTWWRGAPPALLEPRADRGPCGDALGVVWGGRNSDTVTFLPKIGELISFKLSIFFYIYFSLLIPFLLFSLELRRVFSRLE